MSFKASFYCDADAKWCEFSIWEDGLHSSFNLSPGETTLENVGEGSVYVGVKNGQSRGLEDQARPVAGGTNTTFLE